MFIDFGIDSRIKFKIFFVGFKLTNNIYSLLTFSILMTLIDFENNQFFNLLYIILLEANLLLLKLFFLYFLNNLCSLNYIIFFFIFFIFSNHIELILVDGVVLTLFESGIALILFNSINILLLFFMLK